MEARRTVYLPSFPGIFFFFFFSEERDGKTAPCRVRDSTQGILTLLLGARQSGTTCDVQGSAHSILSVLSTTFGSTVVRVVNAAFEAQRPVYLAFYRVLGLSATVGPCGDGGSTHSVAARLAAKQFQLSSLSELERGTRWVCTPRIQLALPHTSSEFSA